MTFFSRLESRIREIDSLLCVGLDPHPDDLPEMTGSGLKTFCLDLIAATVDLAAAYKPNAAFFEVFGPEGAAALREVIAAIPDEIPVILDAKRGDISSTARAYAQAAFQTLGADAITVNPYLGYDAVEPFIGDSDKGVFLLCKTSNPGASDLQDLRVVEERGLGKENESSHLLQPPTMYLHERVAKLAQTWNTRDNLGLVVGATQPESLARVRAAAPDLWILAPGIGAQGGDIRAALQAGLRPDGLGMLIPISRGISRTADPRLAAQELRAAINIERRKIGAQVEKIAKHQTELEPETQGTEFRELADGLLEAGCIKFGEFTLKSGVISPIYIDLRRLVGYPGLLSQAALAYTQILMRLQFNHLAALPYAALPIGTAISLHGDWSLIYPRKEVKAYGTRAQIEGVFQAGDTAVVIDDLISTGGSKFEGIEVLTSAGLAVVDVVVLIDRSADGGAELSKRGFTLHAVLSLEQLLKYYQGTGQVPEEQTEAARSFLKG